MVETWDLRDERMIVLKLKSALSFILVIVITALASLAACAEGEPTEQPPAGEGKLALESLLADAELPYVKLKNDEYKVVYTQDGATTTLFMKQDAVGDLPEDQLIYFYTMVMRLPDGDIDISPVYKKMAEYNDNLLVGRISINGRSLFYSSSFWLRNADEVTLDEEIAVAHYTWQEAEMVFTEALQPAQPSPQPDSSTN